jgi:hypothetical protein
LRLLGSQLYWEPSLDLSLKVQLLGTHPGLEILSVQYLCWILEVCDGTENGKQLRLIFRANRRKTRLVVALQKICGDMTPGDFTIVEC